MLTVFLVHILTFHSPNDAFDEQKLICKKVQVLKFFSFMIIVTCVLLKKYSPTENVVKILSGFF